MRAARSPDRTQTTAGANSHRRPDRTYSTPSWCEPDRRPSARPIRRSGRGGRPPTVSQNAREPAPVDLPQTPARSAVERHTGHYAARAGRTSPSPGRASRRTVFPDEGAPAIRRLGGHRVVLSGGTGTSGHCACDLRAWLRHGWHRGVLIGPSCVATAGPRARVLGRRCGSLLVRRLRFSWGRFATGRSHPSRASSRKRRKSSSRPESFRTGPRSGGVSPPQRGPVRCGASGGGGAGGEDAFDLTDRFEHAFLLAHLEQLLHGLE